MKNIACFTVVALLAAGSFVNAQSKRTADFLRLAPQTHEDKEVTVDVSMVKPVLWKSPLEDVSFFHALTIDRTVHKGGGTILVAVPAADAEKFAKKYGTTFDGRNDKDKLTGTFILVSGRGPSGFWLIDTTGKLAQLIKDKKLQMPDAAKQPDDLAPNPDRRRPMNRL
jgi:hypothetical protein